ncbi:MAG: hypothetical protein KatS3mg115_2440 [Candidatus Poribacteria bacterium]|nr:MAG: hypothetical protein KatS3mg115_2440 [Candidatus Poribacteria bacterium]
MSGLEGRNCSIWICTTPTEQECLERSLFGASDALYGREKTKKGDVCFLYNIRENRLWGVFEAVSDPDWDLDPQAWEGKFRYQIRVRLVGDLQRIEHASGVLEEVGLKMARTRFGELVPRFSVFGPSITRQLLARFSPVADALSQVGSSESDGSREVLIYKPERGFKSVAGLEEVKRFIRERMVEPFLYPAIARAYRLRAGGGLLLYGPPGTGKTLIAQATANEIDAEFLRITPSVVRGFPGEPERHLELLFQEAMRKPRCVIFIDEADALLAKRENIASSTVMQRVVPTLLSLFTNVADNRAPVLIIAATNSPWDIDEAFLRPGRLDLRLEVPLPDLPARVELLGLKLAGRPLGEDLRDRGNLLKLAERLEGWSGADIELLVDRVALEVSRVQIEVDPEVGKDPLEEVDSERLLPITLADLEDGLRKGLAAPSVSRAQLDRLREWSAQWSG